jgi:hypothetical protein
MRVRAALTALSSAVLLLSGVGSWAADTAAPKLAAKPAAKAGAKTGAKTAAKPAPAVRAARKVVAKPAPKAATKATLHPNPEATPSAAAAARGPAETLTCRDGTEDRHARIGVILIGGRVDEFAYYSKWKPRTCSIYLRRSRDPYSRWVDKGSVTNVSLERGLFVIEHGKGEYRFVFRDVDRERYCGMDGTINGILTVRRGSERCELTGVMEEGVPLGQAYAHLEHAAQPTQTRASASTGATTTSAQAAPRTRFFQWFRSETQSAWPAPTPGLSD